MRLFEFPETAEQFIRMADYCLECDDLDGALIYTHEACKKEISHKQKSEYYVRLGELYFRADNREFAERALMRALLFDPYNHNADVVLYILFICKQEYDKATYYLNRFRTVWKASLLFDTIERLGLRHDVFHDYFESILAKVEETELLRQGASAISAQTGAVKETKLVLHNLALKRKIEDARNLEETERAVATMNASDALDTIRRESMKVLGRNDSATAEYYALSARILRRCQYPQPAESMLNAAELLDAENTKVMQERCLYEFAFGDKIEAEDLLFDLVESEEPLTDMVREMMALDYLELLIAYCEFSMDKEPYSYYLYDTCAHAYYQSGEYEKARKIWVDCVRIFGSFTDAPVKLTVLQELKKEGLGVNPAEFFDRMEALYVRSLTRAAEENGEETLDDPILWYALDFPVYREERSEDLRLKAIDRIAQSKNAETQCRLRGLLLDRGFPGSDELSSKILFCLLKAGIGDTVLLNDEGVVRKILLRTPKEAYAAGEGFLTAYYYAFALIGTSGSDMNELKALYWKTKEIASVAENCNVPIAYAKEAAAALITADPDQKDLIKHCDWICGAIDAAVCAAYREKFRDALIRRDNALNEEIVQKKSNR